VALFFVHFHLQGDFVPIQHQEPVSLHPHQLSLLPLTLPFHHPLLSTSITMIITIIIIIIPVITVQLHLHVSIYTQQILYPLVYGSRLIPGLSHRTGRFQTMLLQQKRIVQFRLRKRHVCVHQRIIPVHFDAVFTRTTETTAAVAIRIILQLV
jgi:hypothetical protein